MHVWSYIKHMRASSQFEILMNETRKNVEDKKEHKINSITHILASFSGPCFDQTIRTYITLHTNMHWHLFSICMAACMHA